MLYLVGGSGDLPSNWVYDGRVNFMMDNLLAEHKAVPMVIAIPNNQVVHRNNPQHAELTFSLFEAELRQHVIPLVEREYSVRRDPKGRALSGLSMGGRHTQFVGFNSLDLFANFGVLSAGDVDSEKSIAKFLNDPNVNKKIDYLFVGQGTDGSGGPVGRPLRGPAPGAAQPQDQPRILRRRTTAATTGPHGATCSTPAFCRTCGGRSNTTERRRIPMRKALLVTMIAGGLCLAQTPGSGQGRRRVASRNSRRRVDGLPGHPVRRAAGRRPAMARASARGEVGGRAASRQVRPACVQGTRNPADAEQGPG